MALAFKFFPYIPAIHFLFTRFNICRKAILHWFRFRKNIFSDWANYFFCFLSLKIDDISGSVRIKHSEYLIPFGLMIFPDNFKLKQFWLKNVDPECFIIGSDFYRQYFRKLIFWKYPPFYFLFCVNIFKIVRKNKRLIF